MLDLLKRYADRIEGFLSCFDRLIIWGTLPSVSHPGGLHKYLSSTGTHLHEFSDFAIRLRDQLDAHLIALARAEQVQIEYLPSPHACRKEARIQSILQERGTHPGLVHIFTVLEPARVFEARKGKGDTASLIMRRGKCKHYYLYFIDPQFGLCHLRISTWLPFWTQFYCNGHSWLARELERQGIPFTQVDNAFTACGDWPRAQALAAAFPVRELHQALDGYVQRFCPVIQALGQAAYHWSITQAEFATDVVFRRPEDLRALYDHLRRQAIHTVRAADIATFVSRPLPRDPAEAELGSNLRTTLEGTRVRHQWGRHVALKMYDKHGVILRIETTTSDVSFFHHHREVVHRDGTSSLHMAPMRKTIYSLPILGHCLAACNRRYLAFLTALDDPTCGAETVEQLAEPAREHNRSYRGFNLFARSDMELFLALTRGEWCIRGFSNADLRRLLQWPTRGQVSALLKRLRLHALITRQGGSYRYRLTETGQRLIIAALRLRQEQVVPALAGV